MSGYEKQNWPSQYAAPQGQGEYQQQPPYETQQVWNQQPSYGQQQGGYQPPPSYPPQQGGYPAASSYSTPQGYGAPPPGPYGSPQPQQGYGSPPHPQGQYSSPQLPPYGAPPPSQGQYGSHQPPAPPGQYSAPPPQGQYGSPQPHYGAPPQQQQQQQWGGVPPQGPPGGLGGSEKRHSVCFKFSGTKKTILNSQVMDPYGKVPFNVVSDKKHTTVRASDGSTLAVVDWNHSVPIMHYGGKKLKCKEWIMWDSSNSTVRVLTHGGKEYYWVTRNETVYLEPSDRPGFHILIWRDPTNVVEIEAFQESLVVPGLLEAAIVAVVIMQSNHKLGDQGGNNQMFLNVIAGSIGANVAF